MNTPIETLQAASWDLGDIALQQRQHLLGVVEQGGVVCFTGLPLSMAAAARQAVLDARWADPAHKNISFDPARQQLKGAHADAAIQQTMTGLLLDYQRLAVSLVRALAPDYGAALRVAPASLRLLQVEGRPASWRKDDSRLHIDAFPSRPNYGERILRVFHNLHPQAVPRVWRVGEPFADVARRFVPRLPPYRAWKARALHALRVTKTLRSEYDHVMLCLHDAMKADPAYQSGCPQQTVPFAAGSTWVCFSDQTSHAVMSGQFMLEQTLHLPVAAMQQPAHAPLRILETLYGKPLV